MSEGVEKELEMLFNASARGARLVERLHQTRAELESSTANLPPQQLEQGRRALAAAIKSAEAMLQSLHMAAQEEPNLSRLQPDPVLPEKE